MPSYLYRPPPTKSALSVSATSVVIDIVVPMIGRTTILAYIAIPNIARIILSSHYDVSAIVRVLQYI
jgi:hypothetical protein